jgi:hypothetical protein
MKIYALKRSNKTHPSPLENNLIVVLGTFFLNNLSNGLNLFQGKFCLLNNRCLSLENAVKLSLEAQSKKLNQKHNFSGAWQIENKVNLPIV